MSTVAELEQELKQLYRVRETPALVEVPELGFLMIDGQGDPKTSSSLQEAVQCCYSRCYRRWRPATMGRRVVFSFSLAQGDGRTACASFPRTSSAVARCASEKPPGPL